MNRKVFISFLGTNNYVLCKYNIDGAESKPVRFVQEALIEHLCIDWTEKDRIFIFCTSKETTGENGSKEINWLDNGQARISDDSEKIGLEHRLQDLKNQIGLRTPIEQFDIDAGFSEEEIWEIFNQVYSKLQSGDEIYFDVTHAFRSIPLFSIVLFNYSRFMLGTHLMTILYGAFEKLGPAYKVKELPVKQRVAPVIDLTNIARLQEYNQVASELTTFGRVKSISDSIYYKNNEASDDLCRLCDAIDELDEYISLIQLENIKKGEYVKRFHVYLQQIRNSGEIADSNHPISRILSKLDTEMSHFVPRDSMQNIEAAIEWAHRHEMVLQEYPLAEEYIIYRTTYLFENDWKNYNIPEQDALRIFQSILGMSNKELNEMKLTDRIFQKTGNYVNYVKQKFPRNSTNADFIRILKDKGYIYIRLRRNSLAHASGTYSYQNLIDTFEENYKNCIEIICNFEE